MKNNRPKAKKFLLVPSALEDSDCLESFNLVYAGEWCLPSSQFADVSKVRYKIHPFLWGDKEKIHDAFFYFDSAYIKILKILILNIGILLLLLIKIQKRK